MAQDKFARTTEEAFGDQAKHVPWSDPDPDLSPPIGFIVLAIASALIGICIKICPPIDVVDALSFFLGFFSAVILVGLSIWGYWFGRR